MFCRHCELLRAMAWQVWKALDLSSRPFATAQSPFQKRFDVGIKSRQEYLYGIQGSSRL